MCKGLTSKSDDIVQFCGLTVTARPDGFDISVYEKRSSFPFHIRNYSHSESNIPRSILYSAFVGQLHRFYRLSSTPNAFRSCVKDLCRKLVKENGCRSLTLSHKLRSFITRTNWKFPSPRSRFLASLHTDIRDLFIFRTTLALTLNHSSHGKVSLTVVNRSALSSDPLGLKIKIR